MSKDAVLAMYEVLMGEDPTTPTAVRFALQEPEDKALFVLALDAAMPHIRKEIADELREASEVWYEFDEEAAEGLRYAADLVDEKEA